uniref:hypothetical protein n=1 Tax=Cupriavidus taiwanensis TaxID=164546 RepID=UPI0018DC05D7|nr:hypothetical protein [Cupriavidus taiwanensis]
MSGVISTVMESWWDRSFMMRDTKIAGAGLPAAGAGSLTRIAAPLPAGAAIE